MKNVKNSDILAGTGEIFMSAHMGSQSLARDKTSKVQPAASGPFTHGGREIEALYTIFRKPLIRFFRLKLPPDDDPEDNVQAVFRRLVEIKDRNHIDFSRWFIFKIANNIVADRFRWRARHKVDRIDQIVNQNLVEQSPLQDQVFEGKERLSEFQSKLEQLSPRSRQVFLLHRVYGFSHKEISAHMEISVSTVEKHMIKAAQKVNQIMKDMS